MLVFISSNKWFRAGYGKNIRAWIAENADVLSITDFGDLPVFESATTYPMIFVARSGRQGTETRYTEVESLRPPYPDARAVIDEQGELLPSTAIDADEWLLTDASTARTITIMKQSGMTLGDYVDGKIYRGVLTGFNQAFVIGGAERSELIAADPNSAEIIKPFVVGRDIKKWRVDYQDRWLIFTRRGIQIDQYPAVKEHLSRWKRELTPKPRGANRDVPGRKPGSYKWYEIQDTVDYYEEFEKPRIVFPDIAKTVRFALAPDGVFSNDTTFFIVTDDPFLLALLNSRTVEEWYADIASQIRGDFLRFKRQYVERIPVPKAAPSEQTFLADLAKQCSEAARDDKDLHEMELEIHSRVARLYGLNAGGE